MISSKNLLHGGELYTLAASFRLSPEAFLDLSTNTNCFATSLTQKIFTETPYPFMHYPDSSCADLTEALATHEHVPSDTLLVGNGASELIWHTLAHLKPQKVLFVAPMFSEFIRACRQMKIPFTLLETQENTGFSLQQEQIRQISRTDADLIVLCTPNNPGTTVYNNVQSVLSTLRAPRVLIDLSYRDFLAHKPEADIHTHTQYQQALRPGVSLFTLHSFTKFYSCPGLRLGYLIGPRLPVQHMKQARPAWMVSPLAQQVGQRFLEKRAEYVHTLPDLEETVSSVAREARRLPLFSQDHIFEGVSFVLCRINQNLTATALTDALATQKVLVRNCDTIPGMPPGYIRIQARPLTHMEPFFAALENYSG